MESQINTVLTCESEPSVPVTPSVTPTTPTATTTETPVVEETSVYAPNTGLFGNNSSGAATFGSYFIGGMLLVIGLAAIGFLLKTNVFGKKLSGKKRGFSIGMRKSKLYATSFVAVLSAFFGVTILSRAIDSSINGAQAADTLKVSVSPSVTIEINECAGANAVSDTVRVEDPTQAGYTLYVQAVDSNTKMSLNGNTQDRYFMASGGTLTSPEAIDTNSWGLSLQGATVSDAIWFGAPQTATAIKVTAGATAAGDATTVYYSARANDLMPEGTYYGKVIYTAVANAVPKTSYNVQTINGYVDASGDTRTKDYDPDATVTIRAEDRGVGVCFKNWTVNKGGVTLADATASTTTFVMPSADVIVTANYETCDIKLVYNKNSSTASGTMAGESGLTCDSTVTVKANGFTNSLYTFKGWALTATGSVAYSAGTQVNACDLAKAAGVSTTDGTINLYAIWEQKTITYLQEMTAEMCNNADVGYTWTLKDRRDNLTYTAKKFKDNRCWLMTNLRYLPGTGSVTLTAKDTDITSDTTITIEAFTTSNGKSSDSPKVGRYGSGTYTYNGSSKTSVLYNYYLATVGGSWYGDGKTDRVHISTSLCPKNWNMPTILGSNSGEYWTFYEKYMSNSFWLNDSAGPRFEPAGWWGDGTGYNQGGVYGSYFSSNISTGTSQTSGEKSIAASMNIENGAPGLKETEKYRGSSIRCVLSKTAEGTNGN